VIPKDDQFAVLVRLPPEELLLLLLLLFHLLNLFKEDIFLPLNFIVFRVSFDDPRKYS
jgi:hypothetical protein